MSTEILDSAARVAVIRHEMALAVHSPAKLEEAIARLAAQWQRDVQNVHEAAYSAGAEGVLA